MITRCVLFKGTTRVHIIDDKTYGGSLYNQYLQAEAWIKDKLKVTYIIEGMGPRKEVWEIPLEVFKEALINALAHRDYYEQGANTMVEISNPGGVLSEVAENFGRKSASRNPLIFWLFTRMHLVERVASGIPRMREAMIKAGLPESLFETRGFFTIMFNRPSHSDTINDIAKLTKEIVLNVIRSEEGISAPEIAKRIGKSTITVKRYIATLKTDGKIEFRGALKTGGYWILKTELNSRPLS